MKTLVLSLAVAAIVSHPLAAQRSDAERQILAARDTVWRAWYANDTALLHRFVPPSATTADGAGTIHWGDRQEIVDGARQFARGRARLVDLKFTNTQITPAGHTALVTANFQIVTDSAGRRDTSRGRATELFMRDRGQWFNPYWQLEYGTLGGEREIPLPDTLGANFAIADSAAQRGTAMDYDALVGTWEFRFQSRAPDGTFYPSFIGHWTFEKKPGGGLIEDRWRPDDPTNPMALSLYTYRVFDPQRKVWQMIGAHSAGGAVQPGLTWSDGTYRYAIQRDRSGLSRIRYLAIDANHFLWRSDHSNDGGKTWLLDSGTMEAKRISK